MRFLLSPGVNVTEIDLTTVIPAVATTDGGLVGSFRWGPVEQITLVSSEDYLVQLFGKPDVLNAAYWFTASSFLAYGDKLRLVRVVHDESAIIQEVSSSGTSVTTSVTGPDHIGTMLQSLLLSGVDVYLANSVGERKLVTAYVDADEVTISSAFTIDLNVESVVYWEDGKKSFNSSKNGALISVVKNDEDFDAKYLNSEFINVDSLSCARYPGVIGDSLKVSICSSNKAFSQSITGVSSLGTTVTKLGLGNLVSVGSKLLYDNGTVVTTKTVVSITDANNVVTNSAFSPALSSATITADWEYKNFFGTAPNTSDFAVDRGGSNDECHVIVVDEEGLFTGIPGQVLEKFQFLSKASDAKSNDGSTNYYFNVINQRSRYIRFINVPANFVGTSSTAYSNSLAPIVESLSGGSNSSEPSIGDLQLGYDLFSNVDEVDISLLMIGPSDPQVGLYVIQNICEVRKDCVAFVSPLQSDVVNAQFPVTNVVATRNTLTSSSYGIMDSGWKYMYDKYNDTYVWVPLNGDVAGLCVRTDRDRDPWWSPAGYNRGIIKNVVKLAYSPNQAERDDLYQNGINPVINSKGFGTLLFGDKTLLNKPSAFDRINVRRLFIVLEKAIATASKFSLFEFNDEFTRAQFKNLVEPFLRDVKAGRGIYDFRVVCDETNNTPEVIDRNEFVGDIYIKPARSINFIQLNFIAVRTGVAFEEIVGKY